MGSFPTLYGRIGFLFLSLVLCSCNQGGSLTKVRGNQQDHLSACPDAIGDPTLYGQPATAVSHGTVKLPDGTSLSYTTTSGYLPIYAPGAQREQVSACLFFFAYTRDDHKGDASWPISFLSNGGPGSSSDWIHLGGLGPKVIDLGQEGISTEPTTLIDNGSTLLADSDLVFVDPINTGYSRPAKGVDPSSYDGLNQEADAIGDFIAEYLQGFGRLASPKYIVGESYGGMRLPVLGRYLDEKLAIKVNGLIFISPWLDAIGDDTSDMADELPYVTLLPEYAASAWYQKKLSPELEAKSVAEVYSEADAFANGDYLAALTEGDTLSQGAREQIASALAGYTGLSVQAVESQNLRISTDAFRVGLLKDRGLTLSNYDGRMAAAISNPDTQDPTDALNPIFAGIEASYFPRALGIQTDLPYQGNNWTSWPGAPTDQIQGGYLQVLDDLTTFMRNNPTVKVSMSNGYYDFTCPPGEVHYLVNQLPIDVESRITLAIYPGGHPVYFGSVARAAFVGAIAPMFSEAASPVQVVSKN